MDFDLGNSGACQEFCLTCAASAVTAVCGTHCELPASRYFSALGAAARSHCPCAQLSKGALHGRFFCLVFAFTVERMFEMFIPP